jgi:hypothetical protein
MISAIASIICRTMKGHVFASFLGKYGSRRRRFHYFHQRAHKSVNPLFLVKTPELIHGEADLIMGQIDQLITAIDREVGSLTFLTEMLDGSNAVYGP